MRLLYFVDEWPNLFERYLYREIHWMRERGHSVAVIALNCAPYGYKNETRDHIQLAEFHLEDISVLHLDSQQMTRNAMQDAALSFARSHEGQFIDAHLGREPAELACELHLATGIPYAVRLRGGEVHTKTSPGLAQFLSHAWAVCPMSQFLADVLLGARRLQQVPQGIPVKVQPTKVYVVPNSLPRHYLAASPGPQNDVVQVIGAIGRTVPNKRFQDIIEAVAGLVPEFPGVKLKIIGGGWTFEELRSLASQRGIQDRFEITGFKSWADVMALARQLHIYVQSSEMEGCSLSTIEAGFQGIPLVLSRTGANEHCVEEGINGYLFDAGDVTALREHLKSLLRAGASKREQMGKASLEIVGQRFSAEITMPMIEAIYRSAIENEGQSRAANLVSSSDRVEVNRID
jgi:glycosyltransferase involved in cell wall biosynthesis